MSEDFANASTHFSMDYLQGKVSIVIPTLNAGKYISSLLDSLLSQTIGAEIIIIDSGSEDETISIIKTYEKHIRFLEIPQEEFDHGKTRDYALRHCKGEFVIFFTQDALPLDEYCIEHLLSAFSNQNIAGVCGRQIAYKDASEYEKLIREFNYPSVGRVWLKQDIPKYGVKSYFFSNTCAAYRRSYYEKVGGFDTPIITNEDMLIAAKFIHAGYSLCYEPKAAVLHSHRFTLREDYRRNYKIGYIMEQHKDRLYGASSDSEGIKMVRYVIKGLLKRKKIGSIFLFCIHAGIRLIANRIGKRSYRKQYARF